MTAVIRLEIPAPHVALVTMCRPAVRNAINAELAQALEATVKQLESDSNIRVAILTGEGPQAFCSGADLKEVAAGNLESLWTAEGGFAGFVEARRSKPWIAAVNGLALAGGFEIALACDLIVASAEAAFGLPEVARGLLAAAGGVFRLPRALPRALALELIATGDRLSAERALAHGLVNAIASPGQLLDTAVSLASRIASNAPLAVTESLAIARQAQDRDTAALARLSSEAQERLRATSDFQEGPRAFLEKRAPVWKGC